MHEAIEAYEQFPQLKPPTPAERAAIEAAQNIAVEGVAKAARAFLASYDEFYPEYSCAIGENLDALIEAMEKLDV